MWRPSLPVDEDQSLGPVHLKIAGCHRGDEGSPLIATDVVSQHDCVSVVDLQPARVVFVDQHCVASRTRQSVSSLLHHAVELLAAPRGDEELTLVTFGSGGTTTEKCAFPSGVGKFQSLHR